MNPNVYLQVSDNCLWLIWPEGMINLTHLVGTESIRARRDIQHATNAAKQPVDMAAFAAKVCGYGSSAANSEGSK